MKYLNTVVVTGAGVSVESGIQPFRGKDGIWEENSMQMATFRKFKSDPADFLGWYYKRFKSCLQAKPNVAHSILSSLGIKVITQNIDGLHRAASHSPDSLIEIHGCLNEKRKLSSQSRSEIISANWSEVDESNIEKSLLKLFNISSGGMVVKSNSYRPHVLLFDEYYSDLYEIGKAMSWVSDADTIIFMGTSNSVGITEGILQAALQGGKEILVVDPNPSPSLSLPGVIIYKQSASEFCQSYFS